LTLAFAFLLRPKRPNGQHGHHHYKIVIVFFSSKLSVVEPERRRAGGINPPSWTNPLDSSLISGSGKVRQGKKVCRHVV
jgi:hypothetical protein